ncbi:hypothetical protein PI125_g24966 [Phytophthora idaei]|nr:hypothetical protein PI125_g24966 [Phytophthora idaei]
MHLDEVLAATRNSSPSQVYVARFLYELERGVAAMNAHLGASVSVAKCCEWGEHEKARQRTANHAQIGRAVTRDEAQLGSVLEHRLGQRTAISDRLARLEDAQSSLPNRTAGSDQPNPTPAESPTHPLPLSHYMRWHVRKPQQPRWLGVY